MILKLFITFFKIGLFTFGGGYAMIPLIQMQVLENEWLTLEELINFIAVAESTPGAFAINISTFIGLRLNGLIGALFSTLGIILPSFLIILIIAKYYNKFKKNKYVKRCMNGLKPAVIGMIGTSVISMSKSVFMNNFYFNSVTLVSFIIFIFLLILSFKKIHPILIIIISGMLGIISCSLLPIC